MDPHARKKIESAIDEAVEMVEGGEDEYRAARRVLATQTTVVLMELAVAAVVDSVRGRQRATALQRERAAEVPAQAFERPSVGSDPGHRDRSKRSYWSWVEATDEGKAYQAAVEAADDLAMARTLRVIEDFASALKIEWTKELLATEFGLADGTRVTWGGATIDQHRERVAMFQRNVVANAEGAARHMKAVEQLQASGAPTLQHLMSNPLQLTAPL